MKNHCIKKIWKRILTLWKFSDKRKTIHEKKEICMHQTQNE